MLLQALQVIGDEIIDQEFPNTYVACTDADALSGNQEIHSVVVLEFEGDETGLTYAGSKAIDPGDPGEMAVTYGYVNRYNQYDHSLTQRASSSLLTELDRLLAWPNNDGLGEYRDDPLIRALDDGLTAAEDEIRADIEEYDDQVEYKALLTVRIATDGSGQFPGEIETFAKATFQAYSDELHTDSQSAQQSRGTGVCAVCDETETEVYGLGAKLDQMYTSKKQWPFPQYNASKGWLSRPLCGECILAIEVATDRFLNRQSFGAPGVRCRAIPYALPIDGAEEQLRGLIRSARDDLLKPDSNRPLSAAWERYLGKTETFGAEDQLLRLAFTHYIRDSAKAHGVGWIDGVTIDQFNRIEEQYSKLYNSDIVFQRNLIVGGNTPKSPSEKAIFTGVWLFDLLSRASDSDHEGSRIGDEDVWVDITQSVLTDEALQYETLVSHLTAEAVARYQDRMTGPPVSYAGDRAESISEEQLQDYPYDGFHIQRAYALIRVLAELGILTDSKTTLEMNPSSITGDFTSFGDGIAEFIDAHTSIEESPGRQAAFILGATAAQLSNWQQRRGLNKTFLQNRSVEQLTTKRLTRWQREVWEKGKVYNAQAGNYGIPWSDAEEYFHDAVLNGREQGWNATTEELQYHFILGVNVGPRIAGIARENYEAETGEQPEEELIAEATTEN